MQGWVETLAWLAEMEETLFSRPCLRLLCSVWAVMGAWVLSGSVKETDVSHGTEGSGAW